MGNEEDRQNEEDNVQFESEHQIINLDTKRGRLRPKIKLGWFACKSRKDNRNDRSSASKYGIEFETKAKWR